MGRAARNASIGLAGLGAGGLAAALKTGIAFNAQMESNKIALDQLTGSSAKANKLLHDLYKTARRTPFEFRDVVDVSKKFLAFGFSVDQTKSSLDAIGNAVAALGGAVESSPGSRVVTGDPGGERPSRPRLRSARSGSFRWIRPVIGHSRDAGLASRHDGAMAFCIASGAVPAGAGVVSVVAAEATSAAICDAVLAATNAPGCPAARDRGV